MDWTCISIGCLKICDPNSELTFAAVKRKAVSAFKKAMKKLRSTKTRSKVLGAFESQAARTSSRSRTSLGLRYADVIAIFPLSVVIILFERTI